MGTNIVVGRDTGRLRAEILHVLGGDFKRGTIPPLWDGRASERITDCLCDVMEDKELDTHESVGGQLDKPALTIQDAGRH